MAHDVYCLVSQSNCPNNPSCGTVGAAFSSPCGGTSVGHGRAHDPVNRPAHYTTGAVEVIDVIRQQLGDAAFVAYCTGNAIKYLTRAGKKEDAQAQDLGKAAWYAQMARHVLDPTQRDPRQA